jgi:hypothetical protein
LKSTVLGSGWSEADSGWQLINQRNKITNDENDRYFKTGTAIILSLN